MLKYTNHSNKYEYYGNASLCVMNSYICRILQYLVTCTIFQVSIRYKRLCNLNLRSSDLHLENNEIYSFKLSIARKTKMYY